MKIINIKKIFFFENQKNFFENSKKNFSKKNFSKIPSHTINGNLIEAINFGISIFENHYIDRILNKTGQNMVLISAGHHAFYVDENLTNLTKQKLIDNGIGCDLISMCLPPNHHVPLFIFKETQTSYIPAHWIAAFFFDYQSLNDNLFTPFKTLKKIPKKRYANYLTTSFNKFHLPLLNNEGSSNKVLPLLQVAHQFDDPFDFPGQPAGQAGQAVQSEKEQATSQKRITSA